MTENNLTEDYYWEKAITAYRAWRAALATSDVPYDEIPAYRDWRDGLAEWLRFRYATDWAD